MELLIVILAVAASAIYLARRFWRSFSNAAETGCGDGCAGCSGSPGGENNMRTNGDPCLEGCRERPADGNRGNIASGRR